MYFFEMITQKEPLDLYDEGARKELLSDLPIEIQNFIAKGTSYKPEDRHQSPEELFTDWMKSSICTKRRNFYSYMSRIRPL